MKGPAAHACFNLCHQHYVTTVDNALTAQLALRVRCLPVVVLQQAAAWHNVVIVIAAAADNGAAWADSATAVVSAYPNHVISRVTATHTATHA
jgi:hypothetical protein